jgi:hypothetical protein
MARTSPVHVVSVVGSQDAALLSHFVEYYRSLGIDSFQLICHAETPSNDGYIHLRDAFRAAGVEPLHSHFGPWRDSLNQKLKAYAMSRRPDDWYVVADVDEFHVYSHPLHELLEKCERSGADHVNGCFLDPALEALSACWCRQYRHFQGAPAEDGGRARTGRIVGRTPRNRGWTRAAPGGRLHPGPPLQVDRIGGAAYAAPGGFTEPGTLASGALRPDQGGESGVGPPGRE